MSLNYKLDKIKNWEQVCIDKYDGEQSPITRTLIFATIGVGLGRITEKNYIEFWTRLKILNQLHPGVMTFEVTGEDGVRAIHEIEVSDVKEHVGLWTNVAPDTPTMTWLKNVAYQYHLDITRDAKSRETNPTLRSRIEAEIERTKLNEDRAEQKSSGS